MRALVLATVLLTFFGLVRPLPKTKENQRPTRHSQSSLKLIPMLQHTGLPSNNNGQKRLTLERMGPGIDWDHRKSGRDWKISPGYEGGNAKPEQLFLAAPCRSELIYGGRLKSEEFASADPSNASRSETLPTPEWLEKFQSDQNQQCGADRQRHIVEMQLAELEQVAYRRHGQTQAKYRTNAEQD